jgi:hypothetical protein
VPEGKVREYRERLMKYLETPHHPRHPQRLCTFFDVDTAEGAERLAAWCRDRNIDVEVLVLPPLESNDAPSAQDVTLNDGDTLVFVDFRPQGLWQVTVKSVPAIQITAALVDAWLIALVEAFENPEWRFTGWSINDVRTT